MSAPAFPGVAGLDIYCTGMSLRDYFAAVALPPVLLVAEKRGVDGVDTVDETHLAYMAYAMADAMLAEREKKDESD